MEENQENNQENEKPVTVKQAGEIKYEIEFFENGNTIIRFDENAEANIVAYALVESHLKYFSEMLKNIPDKERDMQQHTSKGNLNKAIYVVNKMKTVSVEMYRKHFFSELNKQHEILEENNQENQDIFINSENNINHEETSNDTDKTRSEN